MTIAIITVAALSLVNGDKNNKLIAYKTGI
jgi:hypothetical protein